MSAPSSIDSETVLPDRGRDGALLLYDWFKHMTTLSLITLGGLLGILQGGEAQVRSGALGFIVSTIAFAGMLGFDGQNRLLVAELAGKPIPAMLSWHRRLAMMTYGIGVGGFLLLIVESVG